MTDVALRSRYISLASGGGGLDIGVDLGSCGGAVPVVYVERELTAAAYLAHRMEAEELPPGPVWSDLRTFDARAWRGLVDGVVGGFPCQPYSVAGKRQGAADERDLWDECLRVLVDSGARWAFFENVGGAREEYEQRFGLGLMAAGFRSRAVVVRASDVGAPHQRARFFFAAVADSAHERHEWSGGAWRRWAGPPHASERVADSERGAVRDESGWCSGEGGAGTPESRHAGAFPPGPEGDEWRYVSREFWPALPQSEIRGLADGLDLSRADWLRILGNGVVPQQAAFAWRLLWSELA